MEKFFNTEGPVFQEDHYCIPPLSRWDFDEVLELIKRKKYFVLHAPRQTGKTSCLLALRDYLNHEGRYHSIYMNIEAAQAMRENVYEGMQAILSALGIEAYKTLGDTMPDELGVKILKKQGHSDVFNLSLQY